MLKTIRAIYENGVLRPMTALPFPESTEVVITVETIAAVPPNALKETSPKGDGLSGPETLPSVHQAFEDFSRRAA